MSKPIFSIHQAGDLFTVTRNSLPLLTAKGKPVEFRVKGLAEAMAEAVARFQAPVTSDRGSQLETRDTKDEKRTHTPSNLPLTTYPLPLVTIRLLSQYIDMEQQERSQVTERLLDYFPTDLVLIRTNYPEALAERQKKLLDPHMHWLQSTLNLNICPVYGIHESFVTPEDISKIRHFVDENDNFELSVLDNLTGICHSLTLGLGVLQGRLDAVNAHHLIYIEENYQAELWGKDASTDYKKHEVLSELITITDLLNLYRKER